MSTYKKMNPEAKRVWVNELRSGRYRQTRQALRYDDGFCCLGVLCDLSGAAEWGTQTSYGADYGGSYDYLPDSVGKWAGLGGDTARHLAELNDEQEMTFAKIANWIERHL